MRGALAGLASTALLAAVRPKLPERGDVAAFGVLSLCVVLAFPLLTALALMRVESAHAIVFIGLLPLATAGFGALRASERGLCSGAGPHAARVFKGLPACWPGRSSACSGLL